MIKSSWDAEVKLIALRAPTLQALHVAHGVGPTPAALGSGFFITRRAVDLAGEEEAGDGLGLQAVPSRGS